MIIDIERFVLRARPAWEDLDRMCERFEKSEGGVGLTLEESERFHYLYERAIADLAKLETYAAEPATIAYLQRLLARAYGEMHAESAGRMDGRRLHSWFTIGFPAVFRRRFHYFAWSCFLMLLGAFFGAGALVWDGGAKGVIMPFSHLLGDPSERVQSEESSTADNLEGKATFASSLMTHNIRVSVFAFALGFTFGIGTGVLLFYNGVILGAVVLDYLRAGEALFLVGWLLPHGSVEIPSILLAGQAGLLLGRTLLGDRSSRTVAVRLRDIRDDLAYLMGAVAVLLVWAGLIESFISQFHAPAFYPYKIAFGLIQLGGLIWFLSRGRKSCAPEGRA